MESCSAAAIAAVAAVKQRRAAAARPRCRVRPPSRAAVARSSKSRVVVRRSRAVVAIAAVAAESTACSVVVVIAAAAASRAVAHRPSAAAALRPMGCRPMAPCRRLRKPPPPNGLNDVKCANSDCAGRDLVPGTVRFALGSPNCRGDFCFFRETHRGWKSPAKTTTSNWPGPSERGPASFFDPPWVDGASKEG